MDVVKHKLNDGEKIVVSFHDYFEILKPLIEGRYDIETKLLTSVILSYPTQQKKINECMDQLESLLSSTHNYEKIVTSIFYLYHTIQDFYLSLDNIIAVFDQPHFHTENIDDNTMSQTYKLEAADYLTKLLQQYNTFKRKHILNDATIIDFLSQLLLKTILKEYELPEKLSDKISNSVIFGVKFVQSQFYAAKNTVSLYAKFIQDFIDFLYDHKDRKIMFSIIDLIEEDKDFFMRGNIENTLKASYKDLHLQNPPLKRFGLMPITDSMPLKNLLSLISGNQTSSVDIKKFAKDQSISFIVSYKVVFNPIEYNIRPLYQRSIAKKFIQPETYGITNKIIERFKTIKSYDPKKWRFEYDIIGDRKAEKWCVIESLNGETYRVLSSWIYGTSLLMPSYKIKLLLDYIDSNNQPTRVSNYQAVAIRKAIPNMFLRRPLNLDIMESRSKEIDTQIIKNELFLKITGLLREIIKKDYSNAKNIKNNNDVNNVIHDQRLQDIFANTILQLYKFGSNTEAVQEFNAGQFPFYELLSSYLLELKNIMSRFMKELHDGYNRAPLLDEVFEKKDEYSKANTIIEKLEKIVLVAIETLISDGENIYSELNYKYLLLNFY